MSVEEEEVMVPTTGEEKEKELAEEVNANATNNNFMDDSDDELTEEQKRVIAERIAALQNRFKKFEEKSTENKIEELVMQHGHLNLNEKEAFMILKVCEMNELNAEDRLRRVDDLYQDAGESTEMYLLRILDTETGQFLTQITSRNGEGGRIAKQTLQKNKRCGRFRNNASRGRLNGCRIRSCSTKTGTKSWTRIWRRGRIR